MSTITTYKRWVICYDPKPIPIRDRDYTATHEDYDGPEDNRCITGASIDELVAEIDELEAEQCNGYSNWETRITQAWLTEAGNFYSDMAMGFLAQLDRDAAIDKLADWIRDAVVDTATNEVGENNLFSTFVANALDHVQWRELAQRYFPAPRP